MTVNLKQIQYRADDPDTYLHDACVSCINYKTNGPYQGGYCELANADVAALGTCSKQVSIIGYEDSREDAVEPLRATGEILSDDELEQLSIITAAEFIEIANAILEEDIPDAA